MRLRGLGKLIKQACIDKMPARRCTLYCFLLERRGLGPLAPHSPAFMSQDTPSTKGISLFHSSFLSLSSSVASLMKAKWCVVGVVGSPGEQEEWLRY